MFIDARFVEGHFLAGVDGIADFRAHFSANGQFGQGSVSVAFIDGVDLLALLLCNGNGLDC
ncbi:hypothetical protein EBQ34_14950 [Vandammella animalimorsus]|uniref:Uncharacterized protein n=1 Tax=Vandammella animalimorsus TaxID=2029117 RepID=A0A3M6QVV4_9BURK|nr:hypothetical protein EBQ34_14950 [Vandammella animalimorsus]